MKSLAYRQSAAVRATRKSLIVPAFSYSSTWAGVSLMVGRYSIGNTNKFSLKLPITAPDDSFVAAVSWSVSPYVYRFKLWDDGVLYFPVYNGERIGANAYIEIWSVAGSSIPELSSDWTLKTSKLILPSICANCVEGSETQTVVDTPFTEVPAYQYCNPFCDPLCV